eukprot:m.113646 g.113646  ORF g.113646 m.113646 type:complete len:56 (-) comp14139_c0_seq4:539-706(-)
MSEITLACYALHLPIPLHKALANAMDDWDQVHPVYGRYCVQLPEMHQLFVLRTSQ